MGKERRGIEARGGSIRITFTFKGERCRETLRIPPTVKNLQFAENKRGQILTEIALGSFDYAVHFPDSPRAKLGRARNERTVSQAVQLWLRTRVLTDTTRNRYQRYAARYLDGELGKRSIRSVLRSELEQWRADLAATHKPKTVNNALIILRGAFDLAHSDGIIKSNPAARLQNLRNPRISDADPFTLDELGELLRVFEGQQRNMIDFWWNTGLRQGEIFGLEWGDIDWLSKVVHVRRATVEKKEVLTKTKSERFVHLGPRALAAVQVQRAHTELLAGKVFYNPDTGKPWETPVALYKKFQRACSRAKIRFRPPKQLRHTYASLALSAGEPALYVMNQLGHGSLVMLERHYARWMPRANQNAGAGFDALVAKLGA